MQRTHLAGEAGGFDASWEQDLRGAGLGLRKAFGNSEIVGRVGDLGSLLVCNILGNLLDFASLRCLGKVVTDSFQIEFPKGLHFGGLVSMERLCRSQLLDALLPFDQTFHWPPLR